MSLDLRDPAAVLTRLVTLPDGARGAWLAARLVGAHAHAVTPSPTGSRWHRRTDGMNVLVGAAAPRIVLAAHHDIVAATTEGAIDNGASVALLAALAARLGPAAMDALGLQIAFVDFEEPPGQSAGARAHAQTLAEKPPALVVVCDVLGMRQFLLSHRSSADPVPCLERIAQETLGAPLATISTPHSDEWAYQDAGVPAVLLTSLDDPEDTSPWHRLHTPDDTVAHLDLPALTRRLEELTGWVQALANEVTTTPDWMAYPTLGALARAAREAADAPPRLALDDPPPRPTNRRRRGRSS